MIDRLLNQSATATLERVASFHAARHAVLADNLANVSTPGYRQKDLDESAFRQSLRKRLDEADHSGAANFDGLDAAPHARDARLGGVVFHDGGDRSAEELLGEQAKNALRHNLSVELLRKHYGTMQLAVRERVA